jgi:FXSXX-COOH protein
VSSPDGAITASDLVELTLTELDESDESVLANALRRLERERTSDATGIASHQSTTHSSFNNSILPY